MVTTIQLSNEVKNTLKNLKKSKKETYEEVIIDLVFESKNKDIKELAEEGYKEMAEENLKITKKFEAIENLSGWEWNEH